MKYWIYIWHFGSCCCQSEPSWKQQHFPIKLLFWWYKPVEKLFFWGLSLGSTESQPGIEWAVYKSLSGRKQFEFSGFSLRNLSFRGRYLCQRRKPLCWTGACTPGSRGHAMVISGVVPPPEAGEGTGTSLQLNKTLQGVTHGEQQPKGTPGQGLGRLGSHTAPSPPVDWLLSTEGLGLGDVCGKPEPHRENLGSCSYPHLHTVQVKIYLHFKKATGLREPTKSSGGHCWSLQDRHSNTSY